MLVIGKENNDKTAYVAAASLMTVKLARYDCKITVSDPNGSQGENKELQSLNVLSLPI